MYLYSAWPELILTGPGVPSACSRFLSSCWSEKGFILESPTRSSEISSPYLDTLVFRDGSWQLGQTMARVSLLC
jgi:hypothetical protein